MRFHVLRHHAATLCIVAALAAQPAAAKVISVSAATPDANEKLQEALILADPGDVVELGAGVWKLTDGLSLDVANVTVRGAGAGEGGSVLDFAGQQGAGDAIVLDKVGVLSLNLPDVTTPQSEAKPAPADLSKGTPPAALPPIKLPESMEAKVR